MTNELKHPINTLIDNLITFFDIISFNELTLILKIIGLWLCDVKDIMTLPITVTSVLKVLTNIITRNAAHPTGLSTILVIMSVSTFKTGVILYLSLNHLTNDIVICVVEKIKVTPPDIEEAHPVKHLLESYNSYEDYFNILLPHLLLETWEVVRSSF